MVGHPTDSGPYVRVTESVLTPRERRVLALAACGCGSKQIATRLRVSSTTVRFHFANVFRKLGVGTRAHAVSIALARRWIPSRHVRARVLPAEELRAQDAS